MTKSDLMRRMHRAGLRMQETAIAARAAIAVVRQYRYAIMTRAIQEGMSVRATGRAMGFSHARVVQVVNLRKSGLPRQVDLKNWLMQALRVHGLRVDDSTLAAQVVINMMASERDAMISRLRLALSVRQVASLLGLSKTHVARLSHDVDSDGTAP